MSTLNTDGIIPLPKFATTGWTYSLNEKADGILSHFFEADAYQSNLYAGNVSSMQGLVQQYNSDPVKLVSNVRQTLEQYLLRYYPEGVTVNVTSPATSPTWQGSVYEITITATVTEQGAQYSFGYLVSAENSIISQIARLNNNGVAF